MEQGKEISKEQIEQFISDKFSDEDIRLQIKAFTNSFREIMTFYKCAMMEVSTKFEVLNEEFSIQYDRNPIETIKTRLKLPESIINKLKSRGLPMTLESIEDNISDVAGVRVICGFPSDIYMLADALLKQDDIFLVQKKDYIKNPKPNGYRSLHLVVKTPIFLHNEKKLMKVEVQLRTISMDWWASLEHKIRYKKDISTSQEIDSALLECADISAALDRRMEEIHKSVAENFEL